MLKTSKNLYEKMLSLEVYLSNKFEGAVIKSIPDVPGFFVKFKGEKEFKAKKESSVVAEAIAAGIEITKAQYEKY
jgi:hypothetical protein